MTIKLAELDMDQAACADPWTVDTDWFFDIRTEQQAKAICKDCPIKFQCLEYAVKNEEYGVWGGTNDAERKLIRKTKRTSRRGIANKKH